MRLECFEFCENIVPNAVKMQLEYNYSAVYLSNYNAPRMGQNV